MSQLDDQIAALETEVTDQTTAVQSAIALLNGIVQQLKDALAAGGGSPAQVARVQAVVAALDASTNELAAAVAANTTPPEPA